MPETLGPRVTMASITHLMPWRHMLSATMKHFLENHDMTEAVRMPAFRAPLIPYCIALHCIRHDAVVVLTYLLR